MKKEFIDNLYYRTVIRPKLNLKTTRTYTHLSSDEKQFIKENSRGMSSYAIAKYIGCERTTVDYYIKKYSLPRYDPQDKWCGGRGEALVADYNSNITLAEICNKYSLKKSQVIYTVRRVAEKFGLVLGGRKRGRPCAAVPR